MAVRALQEEGAYHYFEKPIDFDKLRIVLERAIEYGAARRENEALRRQLRDRCRGRLRRKLHLFQRRHLFQI